MARGRSISLYISDLDRVSTPQLFYTYFYNHAHRLRLEKLLYLEPSGSSNGFLKLLLDPDGGFTSEPPNGGFRSETAISEVNRTKI
jgi:hypothetical protein